MQEYQKGKIMFKVLDEVCQPTRATLAANAPNLDI